jgi:5-methylcytosine-specific restriction endonuclease McrA
MDTLVCTKCKQLLPTTAFVRRPAVPRGYQSICKACTRARNKQIKAMPLVDRVIPKAKRCTTCGALKKITEFNVLSRSLDGHYPQCRTCSAAKQRRTPPPISCYWIAGPEGIESGALCTACQRVVPLTECRTETRGYRRRMMRCLACRTISRTIWREENFARDMENQRLWREAHPELLHIYHQTRYIKIMTDPDLRALQYAAVAAREIGKGTLTLAEWECIKATHNYACVYCGCTDKPLTKDHIIPVIDGGKLVKGNVVPACKSCNSKKGTMSYDEFMAKISS